MIVLSRQAQPCILIRAFISLRPAIRTSVTRSSPRSRQGQPLDTLHCAPLHGLQTPQLHKLEWIRALLPRRFVHDLSPGSVAYTPPALLDYLLDRLDLHLRHHTSSTSSNVLINKKIDSVSLSSAPEVLACAQLDCSYRSGPHRPHSLAV